MSYCRNDGEESDVYVIAHIGGFLQCYCREYFQSRGEGREQAMIDHLREHEARGDRVPKRAFDRLEAERDGRPYETDVRRGLREMGL